MNGRSTFLHSCVTTVHNVSNEKLTSLFRFHNLFHYVTASSYNLMLLLPFNNYT